MALTLSNANFLFLYLLNFLKGKETSTQLQQTKK